MLINILRVLKVNFFLKSHKENICLFPCANLRNEKKKEKEDRSLIKAGTG